MKIRIVTDSAADFTQQELSDHRITCVPMTIAFEDESYTDGVNITQEVFWNRLLAGEMAKTSQPSPDAFLTVFEQAKEAGEAVVCILVSSALSGTLQSAVIARSMVDYAPIHIVDSLTAAIAEKVLVLRACQLRDEGKLTASQIATILAASEQSGGCTCARPVYLTVPAFLYGNTQSSDNDGCYTICLG